MKNQIFSALAASALLLTPALSHGATVLFDAADSGGVGSGSTIPGGTDGFFFPAVKSVGGSDANDPNPSGTSAGTFFANSNPFNFSGNGYTSINTLQNITGTAPTAGSPPVGTTTVEADGIAYGDLPNSDFDYIGLAGDLNATSSSTFDPFTLTFNSGAFSSYQLVLYTEGTGHNNAGSNGITFTTTGIGADAASNSVTVAGVTTAVTESGYLSGYAFDITDISVGDTVTVTLSDPQYEELSYFGLTADALTTDLAPAAPEPSTNAAFALGLLALGGVLFHAKRRQAAVVR